MDEGMKRALKLLLRTLFSGGVIIITILMIACITLASTLFKPHPAIIILMVLLAFSSWMWHGLSIVILADWKRSIDKRKQSLS